MPAQNKFDSDFENFMISTSATSRMLKIQTEALAKICRLEPSLKGGIAAKRIAQEALCDSIKFAPKAEVRNG